MVHRSRLTNSYWGAQQRDSYQIENKKLDMNQLFIYIVNTQYYEICCYCRAHFFATIHKVQRVKQTFGYLWGYFIIKYIAVLNLSTIVIAKLKKVASHHLSLKI